MKAVPVEDDLAVLRARAAMVDPAIPPQGGAPKAKKASSSSSDKKKGKKSKKKKAKKKKKKKEEDKGGIPVEEAEAVDPEEMEGKRPKRACQKEAKHLYSGTGVDPRDKVRRRVARRARRHLRRKGDRDQSTSDSSGTSSSTSSLDERVDSEDVFATSSKVKQIYENFPGVLAAQTLRQMKEALLQNLGEQEEKTGLRPVSLLYFRQELTGRHQGQWSENCTHFVQ